MYTIEDAKVIAQKRMRAQSYPYSTIYSILDVADTLNENEKLDALIEAYALVPPADSSLRSILLDIIRRVRGDES